MSIMKRQYLVLVMTLLSTTFVAFAEPASLEQYQNLRAAIQDIASTFPNDYPGKDDFLARVDSLEKGAADIADFQKLQREALLANPLVSNQPLIFVLRPQYNPDHHNTETMFQTNELNTGSFHGGAALKTLNLKTGEERILVDAPEGCVRDPEVYFDGSKLLFSMRKDINDDYHIYEINADGSELRQLTRATGVTDIDPLYLPDDRIAFSSTREPKYCMCNRHIMANLYVMESDGANIHQIGKSTLFEGHGSLTDDGRILYDRWEYVDRNFGDAQALWTVFPDGTNHALYWGNNTASPGGVIDARVIPGTEQTICIFGSCHDRPWGAIAIIDRRLGLDLRKPVTRIWPASAIDLVGEGDPKFNIDAFKAVMPKYEDPYPLNNKYFLCSRMTGNGEEMGLYLLDVFGNEILVHQEAPGCFDPMPIAPRKRPPATPERRNYTDNQGAFYIADVYQGTHMKGVERGVVKSVRVVESPEKRNWTNPPWFGQGQESPAMNWHDFSNKRIIGTAPVEADGSAYFSVPSDTFVYFQLLDENGMMVQSMRSGTIIQSGETQGCAGCHENRRSAAPFGKYGSSMAIKRQPSTLETWHGVPRNFSYMKEVQPVFDANCVRCHDYGKGAGKAINLAGDRDMVFNTSYNELWRKGFIHVVGAGPAQTQEAFSWGSHASKLVEMLRKGHRGVKLDAGSIDRIITWIDLNAPYYPEYSSAYPDNLAGRCPLNNDQVARLSALTGLNFVDLAHFETNQGPEVSFNRPEVSPCIAKLADSNPDGFKEAVEIIRVGQAMLEKQPREDMDGCTACPLDLKRDEKYNLRKEVEIRNRETIAKGLKQYDE